VNRQTIQQNILNFSQRGYSTSLISLPGFGSTYWINQVLRDWDGQKHFINCHSHLVDSTQELATHSITAPTIVILDNADKLAGQSQVLTNLRMWRDRYKYKISFIGIFNGTQNIRQQPETFLEMYEILTEQIIFLSTMNQSQTQLMTKKLYTRHELTLPETGFEELWSYSGGIPSLVKSYILNRLIQQDLETDDLSSRDKGLLHRIWSSLSSEQQTSLLQSNLGKKWHNSDLEQWQLTDSQGTIRSQALSTYLRLLSYHHILPLIEQTLTATEFLIFKFMHSHQQKVIPREKLIAAGWPTDTAEGVSDQALDQVIFRIRKKIQPYNFQIRTVHGRGHILNTT